MATPERPPDPAESPAVMTSKYSPGETARFESYLIDKASGAAAYLVVSGDTENSLSVGVQASNSERVNALHASGEGGVLLLTLVLLLI